VVVDGPQVRQVTQVLGDGDLVATRCTAWGYALRRVGEVILPVYSTRLAMTVDQSSDVRARYLTVSEGLGLTAQVFPWT